MDEESEEEITSLKSSHTICDARLDNVSQLTAIRHNTHSAQTFVSRLNRSFGRWPRSALGSKSNRLWLGRTWHSLTEWRETPVTLKCHRSLIESTSQMWIRQTQCTADAAPVKGDTCRHVKQQRMTSSFYPDLPLDQLTTIHKRGRSGPMISCCPTLPLSHADAKVSYCVTQGSGQRRKRQLCVTRQGFGRGLGDVRMTEDKFLYKSGWREHHPMFPELSKSKSVKVKSRLNWTTIVCLLRNKGSCRSCDVVTSWLNLNWLSEMWSHVCSRESFLVPPCPETCPLVQNFLSGSDRSFLLHGHAQLKTGMQTQDRHLFLFTDILVIAKAK